MAEGATLYAICVSRDDPDWSRVTDREEMDMMRKLIVPALVALILAPGASAAESGKCLVRLRAVYIDTANKSDAIPSLSVPKDDIHVSTKTIPEVDFTCFLTKNIAAELVLTYPQEHDVELGGTKIGTFKHLPPVLSAQYHFLPDGKFCPYVGLGVNLTLISSVDITVPGVGDLDLSSPSIGPSGQVGFDVNLAEKVVFNVDAKYVMLRSDVELAANGDKVSEAQLDPWLIAGGIGYRF